MANTGKNKRKAAAGQLVNFVPDSYLDRTSRPIYAVAYLLVFIIIYEIGTILISTDVLNASISQQRLRVVSFIWLRDTLKYIGFSPRFVWIATPLAVVCILLTLQLTSGAKWRVWFRDFAPMTAECIILSVPLIVLSLVMNRSTSSNAAAVGVHGSPVRAIACAASAEHRGADPPPCTPATAQNGRRQGFIVNVVTGIGAGIYEEFIFRLLMIILLMIVLQDFLGMPKTTAIIISVGISAALFSLHHHFFYVNGALQKGDPVSAARFFFRFLAGVYFAGLFAVRGFGVAAGTHAWYDIVAAVLNVFFYAGP